MNNDEFYRNMASSPVLPQTSQPVAEEIIRFTVLAGRKDTEVIGIHMSSGLSGTVQSVQMVQEMLQQPRLHIIDSLKASMGLGLMVLEAARLADKGAGASTILSRLEEMKSSVRCIFSVQNLEYLISGGRISKGKGLIAGVLNIKPILCIDDTGFIIPYDKARDTAPPWKRSWISWGNWSNLNGQTVGISHAAALMMLYLKENMEERFGVKRL